ncbi:MAG: peptidase S8 [Nitrospirae bacterium]|nr:MAG: peptidase S8 [Nitrospirota bacterium]
MIYVRYGGKRGPRFPLAVSDELVVVRTRSRLPLEQTILSREARRLVEQLTPVARFDEAGVEVLRTVQPRGARRVRDAVRATLTREPDTRFAGRVLCDPRSKFPVLYTENFFVKFEDDCRPTTCRRVLREFGLTMKRTLEYARNAFFVSAPEGTGQRTFDIAQRLLAHKQVEYCHPELIRQVRERIAFPQQWHLKDTVIDGHRINAHAHVEEAWALSQGEGVTIAVIDDGVDIEHEEFQTSGKIVAPLDVTRGTDDPRPSATGNHGTACAGVACADGLHGASGVAPKSRLMPIRLASGLGSQAEADAFFWAAQHGADVISCSWGPPDGPWWDEHDPRHDQVVPLPDSTRLAIDWAVTQGRNGKGCVITWAAGNGNEPVDRDGYASYPKVVAVAACSDRSKKSVYSDFGQAIWCAFPSNDFEQPRTPGIWTTDRRGNAGYNPGQPTKGDGQGHYTNRFGGTSSACPGAAGVAALVLARQPALRWDEVKDILKRACDRIDPQGGSYDDTGHSPFYGYGRLNAQKAVLLAQPEQPGYLAIHTAVQDVPIKDLHTSQVRVAVGDVEPIQSIKVEVDIEHTYIGDLTVQLIPPTESHPDPIVLHDRAGGGTRNLRQRYDVVNVPALAALTGTVPTGMWTLTVEDTAAQDEGRIRKFSLELAF